MVVLHTHALAGTGNGSNSWIVHLEGGGWCYTLDECLLRTRNWRGSSTFWPDTLNGHGFLSDNVLVNGAFYDWNKVLVGYCDGFSFAGYRYSTTYMCPLCIKCVCVFFNVQKRTS